MGVPQVCDVLNGQLQQPKQLHAVAHRQPTLPFYVAVLKGVQRVLYGPYIRQADLVGHVPARRGQLSQVHNMPRHVASMRMP